MNDSAFTFHSVHLAARGRWPEVWAAHGVGHIPKPGKHGPCPGCGGKDRFRLFPENAEHGSWICGQGGNPTGGDGFDLLCHVHGWSKGEALKAVAEYLGITATPKDRQRSREAARKAELLGLESELAHELRVLLIALNNHLTSRELAKNPRFMALNPEWRPLPEDHWEREQLAARRIVAGIHRLYEVVHAKAA